MAVLTMQTTLAELVRRYRVCWEVWPEYSGTGQKSQQVGFELELLGTGWSVGEFDPRCPESAEIHVALDAIARWILETDKQVSFEIDHTGQSLYYSPARGNRPDVMLSIKIVHRTDFENPLHENERNYLKKTEDRLRQLGACEHHWHIEAADPAAESVCKCARLGHRSRRGAQSLKWRSVAISCPICS